MSAGRVWTERVLLFLGIVFYLFVFPHGTHGDGSVRYMAIEALAEHGTWLAQKYPMLGPLGALPLYCLGWLVKTPHWWASRYNAILFVAFLFGLHRLLRDQLAADSRRRLLLLLLTGTMFSKHVTDFYGEVFTATLAALGLVYLAMNRQKGGFLALTLAIVNAPPTIVAAGLALLRPLFTQRRLRYVLPLVFGGALIALENTLRFGALVSNQYLNDVALTSNALPYARLNGFHYPFFFGLLSICLSFGKGILFFSPGLLLAWAAYPLMSARLKEIQALWLLFVAGLVLIYAKWCAWPGDWYWGPRYFLFSSLPAALALHTLLEQPNKKLLGSSLVLLVLSLSVWVGLDGVAFGLNNLEDCAANGGYLMGFCWYTPEYSPLWRPFFAEKRLGGKQLAFAIYFALSYLYLSYPVWAAIARQLLGAFRRAQWWKVDEWRF